MKNLTKVSRQALKAIKGGYRSCADGCNTEGGEICCSGVCKFGVPSPNFPDLLICPKLP